MQTKRAELRPGQESVWDYPRPPRLEPTSKRIEVEFNGVVIADTERAWRVLETSHPPVYYIPREAMLGKHIVDSRRISFCEWKGGARYVDVNVDGRVARDAGWYYPQPTAAFEPIRGFAAFYPAAMDACRVDGEVVRPQPGGFYGGWITDELVGPFKGAPGSDCW